MAEFGIGTLAKEISSDVTDDTPIPSIDPGGLAVLSICESLLISLTENGILGGDEVYFVLEDAANAHRGWMLEDHAPSSHEAADKLIERILARSSFLAGNGWSGVDDLSYTGNVDRKG